MKSGKRRYQRELLGLFPIHTKREKRYVQSLLSNVEETTEYEEIVKELGKPTMAVASYYESMEPQKIIDSLKKKRMLQFFLAFVCAAMLVCWICYCITLREALDAVKDEIIRETETVLMKGDVSE